MPGSCISVASIYRRFLHRSVRSAGLAPRTVEIDEDTAIHFWGPREPGARPVLVLVHGFGPPALWQWRPQVCFFAKSFDVYVPDLVFFGESFTGKSERSEEFQASCVAKLLEKLGIPRYSIVGTSYGGFVAYYMAEKWPERVDKVVIASSAVNYLLTDKEKLLQRGNAADAEELMLPATASRLRTIARLCVHRLPAAYIPNFVLNDFVQTLYLDKRKEKAELLQGMNLGTCETTDVSPLSQEVLIIWGEHDQIFLVEKAFQLEKLLGSKASLRVLRKSGHLPHLEEASKFNKLVNDFLNGTATGCPAK